MGIADVRKRVSKGFWRGDRDRKGHYIPWLRLLAFPQMESRYALLSGAFCAVWLGDMRTETESA